MKYLILIFTILACTPADKNQQSIHSQSLEKAQNTAAPGCACPKILKPVCAEDGQTYQNSCLAQCQGNKTWKAGPCK